MFDIVISGGTVLDGTGGPGLRADVGIKNEIIRAVGDLSIAETRRVIDATGLTVSPGFIDTHTHSDAALLADPQHASGLRQGVTTEILGQDGLSYCPLSPEKYRVYNRYLSGILGTAPRDLDMSSVESFRSHYHKKVAVNTAYLVAHGAVRLETVGFHDTPLVGESLDHARRLIREGIGQGAVGFSTGLSYHPNAWSDTEELIALCSEAREADGVYVTHLRDVNTERAFCGGGVKEALQIGRKSGVKVHFSHYRTVPANAGRIAELLEHVDDAKAEGVDCTLELYPYPSGSTFAAALLPSWAHEGGPDEILDRLRNPKTRTLMYEYLERRSTRPLEIIVLSYLPKTPSLEGRTLSDLAADKGLSMADTLCDLLIEQELEVGYWASPPHSVSVWRQVSKDALELLARPDYMVGSDSIPNGRLPHPRGYGAFPRFLGRLRRQFGVLTLEQMVQRMTDNPARRFGLTRRGRIQDGYYADIVVFDAGRIIDNATYDDPRQFPSGIPFVLVNGRVAVDQERCTGVLAGQAVP